jgi:protein-tyrosine phosphatase
VVTQSPDPFREELRRAPLSSALNFRDMGGYRTADGRTIRWNRLYRSGTTHLMTGDDLRRVVSRGIRYVYDLRSNSERRHYPSRLAGIAGIDYAFFDHDKLPGDVLRLMRQTDAQPDKSCELMLSMYRALPHDFREAYRELFVRLADGQLPLVFNCTAGKDRTGVAAALVLTALGVPEEAIYEDYRLTEHCFDQTYAILTDDRGPNLLAGLERQVWEPMMRADSAYLTAMFEQLNERHGSPAGYIEEALGVDSVTIERIRRQLLEPQDSFGDS